MLGVDEVKIAGEGRHEEVIAVAPNLDTSNGLQPFVDGVDDVLRPAIAARIKGAGTAGIKICAIVVDVVEIGDEGPGIVDFPCRCDVVEIALRGAGIASPAGRDADRSVRIFRPDMGDRQDREVAPQKI